MAKQFDVSLVMELRRHQRAMEIASKGTQNCVEKIKRVVKVERYLAQHKNLIILFVIRTFLRTSSYLEQAHYL